ncbi:hypothetical protein KA005_32550 [bacterium]|nr:hypothetical protein [bacterium]
MVDIDKRIEVAKTEFKSTIALIQNTEETYLNKSLLNLARSQNDMIFALKQSRKYKGGES